MWPWATSTSIITTSSSGSSGSSSVGGCGGGGGGGTCTAEAWWLAARRGKLKLPARSWLIALMLPAGISLSSSLFIIISTLRIVADAPSKITRHGFHLTLGRFSPSFTYMTRLCLDARGWATLRNSCKPQDNGTTCPQQLHTEALRLLLMQPHTAQYSLHGPFAHIFVRIHTFPAERWEHEAPTSRQSGISLCNMRLPPPHPPPPPPRLSAPSL